VRGGLVQLDPQDHTKIDQIDGWNLGVGHIAQGLPDIRFYDYWLIKHRKHEPLLHLNVAVVILNEVKDLIKITGSHCDARRRFTSFN